MRKQFKSLKRSKLNSFFEKYHFRVEHSTWTTYQNLTTTAAPTASAPASSNVAGIVVGIIFVVLLLIGIGIGSYFAWMKRDTLIAKHNKMIGKPTNVIF